MRLHGPIRLPDRIHFRRIRQSEPDIGGAELFAVGNVAVGVGKGARIAEQRCLELQVAWIDCERTFRVVGTIGHQFPQRISGVGLNRVYVLLRWSADRLPAGAAAVEVEEPSPEAAWSAIYQGSQPFQPNTAGAEGGGALTAMSAAAASRVDTAMARTAEQANTQTVRTPAPPFCDRNKIAVPATPIPYRPRCTNLQAILE